MIKRVNLVIGSGALGAYLSAELLKKKEKVIVTSRSLNKNFANYKYLKIKNKIIFEKLCGYKFSIECIEELVKKYPKNIIGVKDSSYNLFENLKIDNFSVLPGSESKLFKGLQLGCSGIITATCNATSSLARKVYDDFNDGRDQTVNQNLCDVRAEFEKYNLISGLHTYFSKKEIYYKNLLPPLSILNAEDESGLITNLEKLNFSIKNTKAA